MNAKDKAKQVGTSLIEMSEVTKVSVVTLELYHAALPNLFETVAMGTVCQRTKTALSKDKK